MTVQRIATLIRKIFSMEELTIYNIISKFEGHLNQSLNTIR